MSLPTPYLPNETRHDIRNTRDGGFFFVPTPLMRQAFCFIVATLSRRYRVGIVAFAMMGSHIHILVVDLQIDGKPSDVPRFRSVLRSTFAQFVKWYWGLENGRIFCPDSVGSSINVIDFTSIEDAIAYIETNPAAAGMEKSPELMKGAVSLRKWLLVPLRVERPNVYFQKRTWREFEELRLVVPPVARRMGHDEKSFFELTSKTVDRKLKSILRGRKREGRKARPLHVLERLRPEDGKGRSAADHSEALIACQDPYLAAMEFIRIRAFRHEHKRALTAMREGESDVLFPAGTYLAAVRYGVSVRKPWPTGLESLQNE